jgi:hypothetical protein
MKRNYNMDKGNYLPLSLFFRLMEIIIPSYAYDGCNDFV